MDAPDRPLALVTGSARGIGAEVARQLAETGYAVVVTARDADAAAGHAAALVSEGHDAVAIPTGTFTRDGLPLAW